MDEILEALADVYRRRLLVALHNHNSQEDNIQIPEDVHGGQKSLDSLRMEMHHVHLPKLEDAGFIHWDSETQTVEKGPRLDEITPLLSLVETNSDDCLKEWA